MKAQVLLITELNEWLPEATWGKNRPIHVPKYDLVHH